MQKNLLEELLEKPQRETAGSDTSSRFDYQKNWAFCEMLRRHMVNADYLVAFEFHDDTVFLSPSATPPSAEFFQVKTSKSTNARKVTDLTSRAGKPNSILGKMFQNFTGICSSHVVQIILVSNVAFEFSDKNVSAKDLAPITKVGESPFILAAHPSFAGHSIADVIAATISLPLAPAKWRSRSSARIDSK